MRAVHQYPSYHSCYRRWDPPPYTSPIQAISGPNPDQARRILIHPLPSGVGWALVPSHWARTRSLIPYPVLFLTASFQGPSPFSTVRLPNQASRTSPAHLVLVTTTNKYCPLQSVDSRHYEVSSNVVLRPSTILHPRRVQSWPLEPGRRPALRHRPHLGASTSFDTGLGA